MKYVSYILFAGILWGIISIFLHGLELIGFSTFQCVALRLFFATLFLLIVILVKDKKLLKFRLRDLPLFIGMGLGCLGSSVFYLWDISLCGSSAVPALLLDTSPIFVLILSSVFLNEKITPLKIAALVLTIVGVLLVTGVFSSGNSVSFVSILIGLLSGISYAVYSIINKKAIIKYDSLTITFYAFFTATIVFVPFSGIFANVTLIFNSSSILYILGLSLISTVIPFLLYSLGLKGLPASKVSILANTELLVASIVGILYFGEDFSLLKIVGFILVVCAIVLLNLKPKPHKN